MVQFSRFVERGLVLVVRVFALLLALSAVVPAQEQTAAEEAPSLFAAPHGFVEVSFKNAYVTPRGLVVHTTGLATQALGGLVLPFRSGDGVFSHVALTTGVWADLHTGFAGPSVGPWKEVDYFVGISAKLKKRFDIGATYVAFTSPPHDFKPEHNIEFKFGYDDSGPGKRASLLPYLKVFMQSQGTRRWFWDARAVPLMLKLESRLPTRFAPSRASRLLSACQPS